jgi:hypothetical protein
VPSSPGPLVEGLADDRGDVRLAFDRKAGETLTVVIDVTLRDEGTPAVSPSAKGSGPAAGVHNPLLGPLLSSPIPLGDGAVVGLHLQGVGSEVSPDGANSVSVSKTIVCEIAVCQ